MWKSITVLLQKTILNHSLSRIARHFWLVIMAHVTITRASKKTPICYVIIDFRNEKFRTHYYRKAEAGDTFPKSTFEIPQKKVVLIKAKFSSRNVSIKLNYIKSFFFIIFLRFSFLIFYNVSILYYIYKYVFHFCNVLSAVKI